MNKNIRLIFFAAMLPVLFMACDKEIAEEENDNEVITTLELHFTEPGGSSPLIYQFDDPDGFGSGSVSPVVDVIRLAPGKTYDVEFKLLNKTINPVEDITGEIEEESAAHRFYILPSAGSNITITNTGNDENGLPLALTSTWTTGTSATGSVRIVLRHYPDGGKAADDPVDSPKSGTDVDTIFETSVE
jgi:hypothetical protein